MSETPGRYEEIKEAFAWTPRYQSPDVFYQARSPIKTDWERFTDPFELVFDNYMRVQAEKQQVLWNGLDLLSRFGLNRKIDHRWHEFSRLVYAALSPAEYSISLSFGRFVRHIPGSSIKLATMAQVIDEIRHAAIERKTALKLAEGHPDHIIYLDRHWKNGWTIQVFRSYFEEVCALAKVDPLQTLLALSFHIEVGISNTIFAALPESVTRANDFSTAQTFMSVQSDETRHMALGYNTFRYVLDLVSDADKETINWWNNKWIWRGYRALAPAVAFSADVYNTNKSSSFKEYVYRYLVQFYRGVEKELQQRGLKPIAFLDAILEDVEYFTHGLWQVLFAYKYLSFIKVPRVTRRDRQWLTTKYPHWESLYGRWWDEVAAGDMKNAQGVPTICQVCQLPCVFPSYHEPKIHSSTYQGKEYHFCSEPCKLIFEHDPDIYRAPNIGDRIAAEFAAGKSLREVQDWMGIPESVIATGGYMAEDDEGRLLE